MRDPLSRAPGASEGESGGEHSRRVGGFRQARSPHTPYNGLGGELFSEGSILPCVDLPGAKLHRASQVSAVPFETSAVMSAQARQAGRMSAGEGSPDRSISQLTDLRRGAPCRYS